MYTVDASVFINGFDTIEVGHTTSRSLLALLDANATSLIEPSLVLTEVAAGIGRTRGDANRAQTFATALRALSYVMFIPLDTDLAHGAARLAAVYRLRAADAIYVVVAQRYGATLISLDNEHHTRLAGVITVLSPTAALAALMAQQAD
jgi:predicted nucleic acid-binding protein